MSKQENMFNKLRRSSESQASNSQEEKLSSTEQSQPKKRGRPATGKRSNKDWVGRTYYVQREVDLDVEGELHHLKREGTEIDKSELVNALLSAWVKWRNGENMDSHLDEISPRRN